MVPDRRSKRPWVFIAATGLTIALGLIARVSAQVPQSREEQKAEKHGVSGNRQNAATRDLQAPAPPARIIVLNAEQIEDKAARDARAIRDETPPDWWAPWAALAMGLIGVLQLVVFGYQALKLRETVKDGEKVIEAATKASEAAARQAKAAEDTVNSLERPHIFIENVRLDRVIAREWFRLSDVDVRNKGVTVRWDVVNYGRSPAIIKEMTGSVFIGTALPVIPTPNRNDVRAEEFVVPSSSARRKFGVAWRSVLTKETLNDLYLSRSHDPERVPTKCFFFVSVRYESVHRLTDEIGVIWEYLVDIKQWIPCEMEGYTYRRLQ